MKLIRLLLFLAVLLVGNYSVTAQDLSLDQLTKLGTLPTDLPLQKMTSLLLPSGWKYCGHVNNTQEVYWTTGEPVVLDKDTLPEAWLSLRPMPGGTMDVLYKVVPGVGFESLQREVKHLKLPNLAVTCLDCEGIRYDGGTYTIAFYSHKKKGYPCIVVVHQTTAAERQAQDKVGGRTASSGN